jgi:hypothetical protein
MFKPTSIQRLGAAMQMGDRLVRQHPDSDKMSAGDKVTAITALAALLLEEDDRQNRNIIVPGRG